MILCYHLSELSVSPINWHLSRHCGVLVCLAVLFGLCVCVFVFLFFVVFGALFCSVLRFGDDV